MFPKGKRQRIQLNLKKHYTDNHMLYFVDRCKLESPESVQKIEATLVKTMMSLLQRRYRERAGLQFSAYISLLTKLRGMSEEYHAVYRKICEDKVLIARAPELLSMLFDDWMRSEPLYEARLPELEWSSLLGYENL